MSEVDALAITGFVTGVVAIIISLYSVSQARRHVKLVERQTFFQRSQVYPVLEIVERSYSTDSIYLTLKNVGKGSAVDIAVKTSIVLLRPCRDAWDFIDSISDFSKGHTRSIYPSQIAIFVKNQKGQITLHPDATDFFSAEMLFYFSSSKKEEDLTGKAYSFGELKSLLISNNIRFAAISLVLVYKDLSETIFEELAIACVVMDVQKHKSIQEVLEDNVPFTQRTVGYEEIPFVTWHMYSKFKSTRGMLKDMS